MPADFWGNALFSLIPTILFGVVFVVVFRAIFRADRTEREVAARIEVEERAKRAAAAEKSTA
jgi:hypothetical protein